MDDETRLVLAVQLQEQEQVITDSRTALALANAEQAALTEKRTALYIRRDQAWEIVKSLRRLLGTYKWEEDSRPPLD